MYIEANKFEVTILKLNLKKVNNWAYQYKVLCNSWKSGNYMGSNTEKKQ